MRISDEQIDEIRERADIVDFINVYVPLKKYGKNYKGLCPFHEEKTPSFVVSPDKQIYHCFGCGAGGNIFKFVMDYKNVSFVEAVKEVADFVGIEIKTQNFVPTKIDKNEKYYELNSFVSEYFSTNLHNSEYAKSVREYLKQRGIKPHTQKTFGLGYALQSRDALYNLIKRKNFDIEVAKKLGLIDTDEQGRFYDKFKGRLIFPIHTANGRIAGFGGRVLQSGTKAAKYINSPESPIYSKRKILYGLYFAKEEIQRIGRAILVEGYMDVISLYQNGIKNVVAASGTSLTEEQVRLLSRYTRNITVIFDADEAGQRAAKRSIEVLLKLNFDIRLLTLPEGEDPDSYIKTHTAEDFRELVNSAKDFLSFQAERFKIEGKLDDPTLRTEAIRELVKSIALINDELKRANFILLLSKNFGIKASLLENELRNYLGKEERKKSFKKKALEQEANSKNHIQTSDETEIFEKVVIKLLFSGHIEIVGEIFDYFAPDSLRNKNYREIARVVYDSYMENIIDPSILFDLLDDNLRPIAADIVLNKEGISPRWGKIIDEQTDEGLMTLTRDFIKKFQLHNIDLQLKQISKEIDNCENEEERIQLLNETQHLLEEKKHLLYNNSENQ